MRTRIYGILVLVLGALLLAPCVYAQEPKDSVGAPKKEIYKGLQVKLDIGSPILEIARSKAKVQSYEMAVNVNLLNRFFPTLELGYAQADRSLPSAIFQGKGGFARVGLDLSALKKKRENPNKLLVGIRLGTAGQDYTLTNLTLNDSYWHTQPTINIQDVHYDVWGEVVIGIQVQVYKDFYMGLAGRLKALFTRGKEGTIPPYYIPGYGYKDDMNFGFNYYVAWDF